MNNLKPLLRTGNTEYDIPSLEPIQLGNLIVAGSTGQGLFITANDIKAYGASNWIIKNFQLVFSRLDILVFFRHMRERPEITIFFIKL